MSIKNFSFAMLSGAFCLMAPYAQAHLFSVHADTQTTEHGSAAVTHIGWGHALPMDDFFWGAMLESYDFFTPNGKKSSFEFNKNANARGAFTQDFPDMTIQAGDAFVNKISFKDGMQEGTYTVAAVMKQTNFSVYIDKKGKERWGGKTMDEVKDAQKFTFSSNFQNFAKAFVTIGKWTEPKPVGHALEIIPLTDLSKVRAGDEVRFKITLNGKPVATDEEGKPKLNAYGENYGAGKSYSIQSRLNKEGIATIRVPEAGRWLLYVSTVKPVGKDNRPELVGKTLSAGYNATASFVVRN